MEVARRNPVLVALALDDELSTGQGPEHPCAIVRARRSDVLLRVDLRVKAEVRICARLRLVFWMKDQDT